MVTATIAGQEIELNDDAFMTDPDQWSREIATDIAREAGIDSLTEKHWDVIEFCRRDAVEKGTPPGVRRITKNAGVSQKEIYALFPRGPGILAAKISGLTKPKSCI